MEPTLIMPNANGATKDGAPKPPRHKLFSGRIIWGVLALTVIAFLIIYFATQNKQSTGLTEAEKMQVLEYLENESVPVVVEESDRAATILELQKKTSNR